VNIIIPETIEEMSDDKAIEDRELMV